MAKTQADKAQEARTKQTAEERQADMERHERNAPQGTQGGADDEKSRGNFEPQEARSQQSQQGGGQQGGQQSRQQQSGGGGADKFAQAIQQVADGVKKLTEAGMGGQQAGQIALEVWKECS